MSLLAELPETVRSLVNWCVSHSLIVPFVSFFESAVVGAFFIDLNNGYDLQRQSVIFIADGAPKADRALVGDQYFDG